MFRLLVTFGVFLGWLAACAAVFGAMVAVVVVIANPWLLVPAFALGCLASAVDLPRRIGRWID